MTQLAAVLCNCVHCERGHFVQVNRRTRGPMVRVFRPRRGNRVAPHWSQVTSVTFASS